MTQEQETCSIHMFMRLYKTNRKLLHFLVKLDLNSLFLFVTRSCIWVALYWIIFNISLRNFLFFSHVISKPQWVWPWNTVVSQSSLHVPCSPTSRQRLWLVKHQFILWKAQFYVSFPIIMYSKNHLLLWCTSLLWQFLPFAIINIDWISIAIHYQKQPLLRAPATNMWSSLWFDIWQYFLVNKIG